MRKLGRGIGPALQEGMAKYHDYRKERTSTLPAKARFDALNVPIQ
jgi:hypothetical protein